MEQRDDDETIHRKCCLIWTFLDYHCRSCLKCSSLRNRIVVRTHLNRPYLSRRRIFLRQNGMYEYVYGNLWLKEKYFVSSYFSFIRGMRPESEMSFHEIMNYIEAFSSSIWYVREAALLTLLGVCLLQDNLREEWRQGDMEIFLYRMLRGDPEQEDEEMPENNEVEAQRLQQANRPDDENRQIDASDIQDFAREDPRNIDLMNNARNVIGRSLQEIIDHKTRRREQPSHLKCRMFLNELIGRQIGCPVRGINMIALIDEAIPNCLNQVERLY